MMVVTSWKEVMNSQPLFQNIFTLRRPRVAIFADIIKIVKIIFEDLGKVKTKVMYPNGIYIS